MTVLGCLYACMHGLHLCVCVRACVRVCVRACVRACSVVRLAGPGQEGMCSLSAAEIHQEPLELDLNPQSQGSSGVCSKFFRRMVFSPLPPPPPPSFFSLSFSAHIW